MFDKKVRFFYLPKVGKIAKIAFLNYSAILSKIHSYRLLFQRFCLLSFFYLSSIVLISCFIYDEIKLAFIFLGKNILHVCIYVHFERSDRTGLDYNTPRN